MTEQANPDVIKDVEAPAVTVTTPAPAPIAAPTTAATTGVATRTATAVLDGLTLLTNQECIGFLTLSSFVYMIETANNYSKLPNPKTQIQSYEVALGVISCFFAGMAFAVGLGGRELEGPFANAVAVFLFLWWFSGVIVTTFFGSYISVTYANGYFAAWFSFVFATVYLLKNSPAAASTMATYADGGANLTYRPLIGLLFSSLVEMGAAITPCTQSSYVPFVGPTSSCTGVIAYAVALGSVSAFFTLCFLLAYSKVPAKIMRGYAAFSFLWWGAGAGIVTFDAPFFLCGQWILRQLGCPVL